jgi:misacylated tRNA(Ala) deacylase
MTELSYLATTDDGYVQKFRARVVALPPGAVVLDRTYFYPTGGGQPNDLGTLTTSDGWTVAVRDVVKSGASVLHRIEKPVHPSPLWTVGAEVEGQIDWDRRHRHMRLHTAQHLWSARIFATAGIKTKRAILAGSRATIDLEGPVTDARWWERWAEEINAQATAPKAVRVRHLPRAEYEAQPASRSGLVPLPKDVDPVRLIDIDGLDLCPCGGTHLRSTGEIGAVKIHGANAEAGPTARGILILASAGATPPA